MSTKHLVPYICPLIRGTLEVPADAPKTAKQQCTFDLSQHDKSGCDNTNYKSKQSVDQFSGEKSYVCETISRKPFCLCKAERS